jgi:hypothetical protein
MHGFRISPFSIELSVMLTVFLALGLSQSSAQQTSLKASALESHEGMTVSALPWMNTDQYKEKFPNAKKSPLTVGIVAIETTLRNDSDESIRVNLDRIRLTVKLSEENRQELMPMTSDEIADAVLHVEAKDPTKTRRLPIPVGGGGKNTRDKHWTELDQVIRNSFLPGAVVAPHQTMKGLLYFDLQSQFDLMDTAHLYIPELHSLEKNRDLTFFDIDLGRPGH